MVYMHDARGVSRDLGWIGGFILAHIYLYCIKWYMNIFTIRCEFVKVPLRIMLRARSFMSEDLSTQKTLSTAFPHLFQLFKFDTRNTIHIEIRSVKTHWTIDWTIDRPQNWSLPPESSSAWKELTVYTYYYWWNID